MRIKKVTETTPVQAEVVDSLDGNSTTNPPSVRAVNEEFSNVKGKILWTNPNPNNAISSALDITLSSGDYDFLEIITKQTATDNRSYVAKIPKGSDGRIYVITLTGICAVRNIRYNSDTSYTFGTISGGGETSDATWCIPLYAVGYKNGLFS